MIYSKNYSKGGVYMRFVFGIVLFLFNVETTFAKINPKTGPNCHIVNSAISKNDGKKYKIINNSLLIAASVPEAIVFKNKTLLYYVNGDFDQHSIFVSEVSKDGKSASIIGPIKLNGEIIKDAVDPDLIITSEGKLRLFYYVGLFTKPVMGKKPNKIYSAVSEDGVNFRIEGPVVSLDGGTDPTVVQLTNGSLLLAIPQAEKLNIQFYNSVDGKVFSKISSLKGGIPELALNNEGNPELLFQEAEGFVRYTSLNSGKSWEKTNKNVLAGYPIGAASPTVIRVTKKERKMFFFKIKDNCTTPPTAYLEDKDALKKLAERSRGKPPLGAGVKPPTGGNATGKPPLGDGVKPPAGGNATGKPPLGDGVKLRKK